MKYMVLLCDGMADTPNAALGGKTPMMCADKPLIDGLAATAELGMCRTVAAGLKPGSDVANLSVMGYDPTVSYTGRSPLEAASIGIELLDMPGILWPKFEDEKIGENLAFTGAIKDAILDTETLAGLLCERLLNTAPDKFCARYKLDAAKLCELKPHELLAAVAKKRGFLISGGELDTERAAAIVLDEFRSAKIGNISLETP